MLPLDGKTALVTGAAAPSGIGRAVARRLAADGAKVVITDQGGPVTVHGSETQRSTLLAECVAELNALGVDAQAQTLDLTDVDAIPAFVDTLAAQGHAVDILVNNAGSLAGAADFLTTTPAQWQTSFAVNLLGPMALSHAVIPHMQRAGWGRIVNIGSTGSLGAEPGFGAYTAMKHGLVGLSKTLAAEFGPDGILCNTVCPGFIATDMHEAANARLAREQDQPLDAIRAQRYAQVALREAGHPENVADAVAFLVGPGGQYITGVSLPVAGGVPVGI